jgi:hypothetical protein
MDLNVGREVAALQRLTVKHLRGEVRRGLRRRNARPQQGLAGLPANGITPRKFAAMVGNSPTLLFVGGTV